MNGPRRSHQHSRSTRLRRGVARADLIVAAGCTLVACAAAVPVLGRGATDAGEARSRSNLQLLASANASYAATYGDRQFTAVPEDAGLVGGSCTNYLATIACPPQLLLGLAPDGGWYGFFLGTTGL